MNKLSWLDLFWAGSLVLMMAAAVQVSGLIVVIFILLTVLQIAQASKEDK